MSTAPLSHLKSCHCCGLVQKVPDLPPQHAAVCPRCHTWLPLDAEEEDNTPAAAAAATGLVLFLPAVTLPFLRIERLGHTSENSLVGGVGSLLEHGEWFVGAVVLVFSVILPPVKLLTLLVLSELPWLLKHRYRAWAYRAVEQVGRWGMLDVLFVAVLIAFIKFGDLMRFTPGPGLLVFGSFVFLSLIASYLFKPHFLWEEEPMTDPTSPSPSPPPGSESSQRGESSAEAADEAASQPQAGEAVSSDEDRAASDASRLPQAPVRRKRRRRWLWLIPIVAILFVATAVYQSWSERGLLVHITFADGHGIKPGDALRYNGIVVGKVERVGLARDLESVRIDVRLSPGSEGLARQGARFWIVRPEVRLAGISGLETVVGAKYLSVLPGEPSAPPETRFVGLKEAPLIDTLERGGIEIVLQADDASGLADGSPVFYRRLRVGGVKSIGLASDGSAIEAVLYIRPQFRQLIRENTKFWNASGVRLQGGLTGFSLQVGPVETLLRSGIAMAVPPDAGDPIAEGHRFVLHDEPHEEWLAWKPTLGSGSVPDRLPRPQRCILEWDASRLWWSAEQQRSGWVLRIREGLLGPADLLSVPEGAVEGTSHLLLAGKTVDIGEELQPRGEGISLLKLELTEKRLKSVMLREPKAPLDVLLVADPTEPPLFVSTARLTADEGKWVIDKELPVTQGMHGAAAVSVEDGAVVGFVLAKDGGPARIATYRETPAAADTALSSDTEE